MKAKFIITLLAVVAMASFAYSGVTEMKIWCDEPMPADPGEVSALGDVCGYGKPANFFLWSCTIQPKRNGDYFKITSDDPEPAAGPYCMDFMLNQVPSNAMAWWVMRRADANPGWNEPFDASSTERVTFWIKAEPDTPPLWFYPGGWDAPSGARNYGASIRIEGETVVTQDEFGEFGASLKKFDGSWQFVSLPWNFIMETDSLVVDATVPISFVHEGNPYGAGDDDGNAYAFTNTEIRTLNWSSKTTDDGPWWVWYLKYYNSADCKWNPYNPTDPYGNLKDGCRYSIDEIVFCLNDGTGITDVDGNTTVMPLTYELGNNYPNPFNPTTEIEYGIPVSNHVSIEIFNELGQKVKTLVDRYMTQGKYHATWDGTNDTGSLMPSGMYFYKMTSSHFTSVKKMMLLK
jgi:hypothetical protein